MRKTVFIALLSLSLLGLIFLLSTKSSYKKYLPISTEYIVKKGNIVVGFEAEGKYFTDILEPSFVLSGKIADISVKVGDKVTEGSKLATLDTTDTAFDVLNAKANLDKATAAHHAFEANFELINKVSFETIDWIYYNEQENQLREAKKSAQALYDKAIYALNKNILYSPIEGTIIDIYYQVGETVQNQNQSNPILAILPLESKPYVEVYVEDIDISKIKANMKAVFTPDANDAVKYQGVVDFVSPKGVTDGNGLVTYKVRVILDNVDGLFDGFVGNVSFILKEKSGVLIIPNKAVKVIDNTQYVFSYPDFNTKVNVTTGLIDGKNVEVLEGLNIDDKIAIIQ